MTTESQNPLLTDLADNLPRVSVTLPTMGLFYDNSIVDKGINFDDAPVQSFTIWQESLFSDPYTIISGRATADMVQRVAPWVYKPLDLARIDVEMIMIGARLASYGENMELEIECSNPETHMVEDATVKKVAGQPPVMVEQKVCGAKSPIKLDTRDMMGMYPSIENIKKWTIKLNGQTILLRPPRIKDEFDVAKIMVAQAKKVSALSRNKIDNEEEADNLLMQVRSDVADVQIQAVIKMVKSSIASVKTSGGTEVRDDAQILEWLSSISPKVLLDVKDKVEALLEPYRNAGKFDFKCPLCGFITKEVPVVSAPEHFFHKASK